MTTTTSAVVGKHTIANASDSQLELAYDDSQKATFTVDNTGELTIGASGSDVNVASGNTFRVLNGTSSTDWSTGALVVTGGIGANGNINISGGITTMSESTIGGRLNVLTLGAIPQLYIGALGSQTTFFSDTNGDLNINAPGNDVVIHSTDKVQVLNTTATTSTTTGALVVGGGIGVADGMTIGGVVKVPNVTASTNATTGALVCTGGMGVGGDINTTGVIKTTSATSSTNTTTGALVATGGIGVGGNANVGGVIKTTNNTAATALGTGALVVDSGGASIAGKLYTGDKVVVTSTANTKLELLYDATHSAGFGVDSAGNLSLAATGNVYFSSISPVSIQNTTASSSKTTGALVVTGGTGIGGTMNANAIGIVYDATRYANLTVNSAGNLTISPTGYIYAPKQLWVADTTASTTSNNGALIVTGGVGIGGAVNIGDQVIITRTSQQIRLAYDASNFCNLNTNSDGTFVLYATGGNVSIHNSNTFKILNGTASTSIGTGALTVAGGVGVVGDIYSASSRVTTLAVGGTAVTGISTDGTLAANSDSNLSTQKAVKTYVDTQFTNKAGLDNEPWLIHSTGVQISQSAYNTNLSSYQIANTTATGLFGSCKISHRAVFSSTTPLTPHCHIQLSAGGVASDNIILRLYLWYSTGGANFVSAYGGSGYDEQTVDVSSWLATDVRQVNFTSVATTGLTKPLLILTHLQRIGATDTFNGTLRCFVPGIHYTSNKFGEN